MSFVSRFATLVSSRFVAALLLPGVPLVAQVGDRADVDRSVPPGHWVLPDGQRHTPEETVRLLEVPPGFKVEVVAAEPLIQDPVAIQFDERGRLWALEWPGYNWALRDVIPGLEKLPMPKGRVVMLEDTNQDGRMDRRSVFMDDIDWPRGLQVSRDGALVMALPDIVFARDRDGDGRADERETISSGLEIPANPHAAQSTLMRSMDNWIYTAKVGRRLRQIDGQWTAQPYVNARAQWGLAQDNYGRIYYASNGDHLRADLVPARYFTRNPNQDGAAGVDERLSSDQTVWPQGPTPGVNRRAQLREENGALQVFTSNTAPCVYRGDQFPPEYVGNVFFGEVAGRFMRRSVLTETDGMITARNAYEQREFLYSKDERFRAVFTANGPDGALYVTDMHRGIIEGDIFVTSFLRQQFLARKLEQPFNGLGRVYRISYRDRPPGAQPKVERGNLAGWVPHLAHPNGFWRDTAQRLLVEAGDRSVVPAIRTLAHTHADSLGRLHALWTLDGLSAVDTEVLRASLADPAAPVRMAALQLAEPKLADPTVQAAVLALQADPQLTVRRQLLFTLGAHENAAIARTRLALLARDAAQPVVVEAALSGLNGREAVLLGQLLDDPQWGTERPGAARLFSALAQAAGNAGNLDALDPLLQRLTDAKRKPEWARLAVLDGLKATRRGAVSRLPASLVALDQSANAAIKTRVAAVRKTWSEPVAATPRPGRAMTGPVFERGKELFGVCAACHGPEGKGQPTIAPPLEGSKVIAGTPDELVRSVLFGRNLDRKNTAFPDMPGLAALPDADIAAVTSYIRARFGDATRQVTVGPGGGGGAAAPPATSAANPPLQ
jgi:mono/diheme cytochrome c family protein/glucose/arabinose dehydrogenase